MLQVLFALLASAARHPSYHATSPVFATHACDKIARHILLIVILLSLSNSIHGSTVGQGCAANANVCNTAGQYCSADLTCQLATIGSYAIGDGLQVTCNTGYTTTSAGSTSVTACNRCDIGYYSSNGSGNGTGNAGCNACNTGHSTVSTGTAGINAAACTVCAAGYGGSSVSGSTGCVICSAGNYKKSSGNKICTGCDSNGCNNQTASDPGTCDAGFYSNNSGEACYACPSGTYKTTTGNQLCTTCSANNQGCGDTSIGLCLAGYGTTDGGATCSPCLAGQYKTSIGNSACSVCKPGYTTSSANSVASTLQRNCNVCIYGYYSLDGSGNASDLNTGEVGCALCDSNALNCGLSTSGDNTSPGECKAGYGGNGVTCTVCAEGTYKSASGNSNCLTCSSNNTGCGSTNVGTCNAGYGTTNGGALCTACSVGKYKLVAANTECTDCSGFSSGCGATSAGTCNAGYSSTNGGATCTICPQGTYKASGNTECINCPVGYSTNSSGRTVVADCTICAPGSGSVNSGATCSVCPAGRYTPTPGTTACIPCNIGTSNVQVVVNGVVVSGPTSCNLCDLGYGRATDNDITTPCTICQQLPNYSFKSVKNNLACGGCPANFFYYTPNWGPAINSCTTCNPRIEDPQSAECPAGTYSSSSDHRQICTCSVAYGRSSDDNLSVRCNECPAGKYKDVSNNKVCYPCPPGKFMGSPRAVTCQTCPLNTFSVFGFTACQVPTGQPSSRPTGQPTGSPTGDPTRAPTAQPSTAPTSQPTSRPTGQPTSQPSRKPTRQPTGQPTSQPSRQPTKQPTGQPTRQPTGQPTRQPTRQPSSSPTAQPTGQPTKEPSGQPSGQPTSDPTCRPTVQPSGVPSTTPSAQPSARPTGQPTRIPTGQPTSVPSSSAPTLTDLSFWERYMGRLVNTMTKKAVKYGFNIAGLPHYPQQIFKQLDVYDGFKPNRGEGTCSNWLDYSLVDLAQVASMRKLDFIQLLVSTNLGGDSFKTAVCNATDPGAATILSTLISSRSANISQTVQCGGKFWTVTTHPLPISRTSSSGNVQPFYASICVDCFSDNSLRNAASALAYDCSYDPHGLFLRPCYNPCEKKGVNATKYLHTPGVVRLLNVVFAPLELVAQITGYGFEVATTTSLSFRVGLTARSNVYCVALDIEGGVDAPPSSTDAIRYSISRNGQGSSLAVDPSSDPWDFDADVLILGLTPVTKYDVYCMVESRDGFRTDLNTVLNGRFYHTKLTTKCCKIINIVLDAISIKIDPERGDARYPRLASVTVQQAPSKYIEIQLSSIFTPSKPVVMPSKQILYYYPERVFFPNKLSFKGKSSITTGNFSVVPPFPYPQTQTVDFDGGQIQGWNSFNVSLIGPSKNEYVIKTTYDVPRIDIIDFNSALPAPKVYDVSFTPDGGRLAITFDVATNRAKQPRFGLCRHIFSIKNSKKYFEFFTSNPTMSPTGVTQKPTGQPTISPTGQPTTLPTSQPSRQPTCQPSGQPTRQPTTQPTAQPSRQPSRQPSSRPTGQPSRQPTGQPTFEPTGQPTRQPTSQPSRAPTGQPTRSPSRAKVRGTYYPTGQPTRQPTRQPTSQPSRQPSAQPTTQPSLKPSGQPTSSPSQPTGSPSGRPSKTPSGQPTSQPTRQPTGQPSKSPSGQPTGHPTGLPTCRPTCQPTGQPTRQPAGRPTSLPSGQPSGQPTGLPTRNNIPTGQPTGQPSGSPNASPTMLPTIEKNVILPSKVRCDWANYRTVEMYVSELVGLTDNSNFRVRSGVLKAKCIPTVLTGSCNAAVDNTTSNEYWRVMYPKIPVVVSLDIPSTISVSDPLMVDLGKSTGAGGKGWSGYTFTVSSSNNPAGANLLQTYLNSKSPRISPPLQVPHNRLSSGWYQITVKLCNFMLYCGTASAQLTVIDTILPFVTISGPEVIPIGNNQALLLESNMMPMMLSWNVIAASTKDLTFSWKIRNVEDLNDEWLNIKNTSPRKNAFLLPPYTLNPGVYLVQVTVKCVPWNRSGVAKVHVVVERANIVVNVKGGSAATVAVGSSFILDAGMSFDAGEKPIDGIPRKDKLSFSWACAGSATEDASTCPLILLYSFFKPWQLSVSPKPLAQRGIRTTACVTVTAWTSSIRYISYSVTVTIIDVDYPRAIVTNLRGINDIGKINGDVGLIMETLVTRFPTKSATSKQAVQLTWVLDGPDAEGISIGDISNSDVTTMMPQLPPTHQGLITIPVNFVISPNTLPQDRSFALQLRATILNPNTIAATSEQIAISPSIAAIAIMVNDPPNPGTFSALPEVGNEITSVFKLSALDWKDLDLPLAYQFGFSNLDGSFQALSLLSPETTLATGLPSVGIYDGRGYRTVLLLNVADVYNAKAVASFRVVVNPNPTSSNAAAKALVKILKDIDLEDTQSLKSVIGVGAAFLNRVNCTNRDKAFCSKLNRFQCTTTPLTCGPCFDYVNYIGESGHKNKKCHLLDMSDPLIATHLTAPPTPFNTPSPTQKPTFTVQLPKPKLARRSLLNTFYPTCQPTGKPTLVPSGQPTSSPSVPTSQPTTLPTAPTGQPTGQPTGLPTSSPTNPTGQPTSQPSRQPTGQPTSKPTNPTGRPTGQPTFSPTELACGGRCAPWMICSVSKGLGVCLNPLLTCPNDCSGNGECKFVDTSLNKQVPSCRVAEQGCYSVCKCYYGYFGETCEIVGKEQYDLIQTSRNMLVDALAIVAQNEVPSPDAVQAWLSTLNALIVRPSMIHPNRSNAIYSTLLRVLDESGKLNIPFRRLDGIELAIEAHLKTSIPAVEPDWSIAPLHHTRLLQAANATIPAAIGGESVSTYAHRTEDVIGRVSELIASQMTDSDPPVTLITSTFRLKVVSMLLQRKAVEMDAFIKQGGNAGDSGDPLTFTSARTLWEAAVGLPEYALTLLDRNYSSFKSSGLVGSVFIASIDHAMYRNPELTSEALSIGLLNIPCPAHSGCRYKLGLWHRRPVNLNRLNLAKNASLFVPGITPTNFSFYCEQNSHKNQTFVCPNGSIKHVKCTGTEGSFTWDCPHIIPTLECGILDSVDNELYLNLAPTATCSPVDILNSNMKCDCTAAPVASRRLLPEIDSHEKLDKIEMSTARELTSLELNLFTMKHTYISRLDPIFFPGVEKFIPFNVFWTPQYDWTLSWVGGGIGFGFIALACMSYIFRNFNGKLTKLSTGKKVEPNVEVIKIAPAEPKVKVRPSFAPQYRGKPISSPSNTMSEVEKGTSDINERKPTVTLYSALDDALPRILSERGFISRLVHEFCVHHRWLSLFYHPLKGLLLRLGAPVTEHHNVYLYSRLLALGYHVFVPFFCIVGGYQFLDTDDGTCESIRHEKECIVAPSYLTTGVFGWQSRCLWTDNVCVPHTPISAIDIIQVAVYAVILGTPAATIAEYIMLRVVGLPYVYVPPSVQYGPANKLKPGTLWGGTAEDARRPVQRKPDSRKVHVSKMNKELANKRSIIVPFHFPEQDIIAYRQHRLYELLVAHARDVRSDHYNIFYKWWGLDHRAGFLDPRNRLLYFNSNDYIKNMLLDTRRRVLEERAKFVHLYRTREERNKRLLYLFVRDFMGFDYTKNIMDAKDFRDSVCPVNGTQREVAWVFLALFNAGLCFATYKFFTSPGLTLRRQESIFLSYVVWLIIEVSFASSATAFTQHVLLPCLAMHDVGHARTLTLRALRDINKAEREKRQLRRQQRALERAGSKADIEEKDEADAQVRSPNRTMGVMLRQALLKQKSEQQKMSGLQLTIRDVAKAAALQANLSRLERRAEFNAPDFFFVSVQLAPYFPAESNAPVLEKYASEDPPRAMRIYKSKFDGQPAEDSTNTLYWLWYVFSRVLSELAHSPRYWFSLPVLVQDVCINLAINAFGAYFTLGMVILYKINPIWIVVPIAVIIVVAHFLLYAGKGAILMRKATYRKRNDVQLKRLQDGIEPEIIEIAERLKAISRRKLNATTITEDGRTLELADRASILAARKLQKERRLQELLAAAQARKEAKLKKKLEAKAAAREAKRQALLQEKRLVREETRRLKRLEREKIRAQRRAGVYGSDIQEKERAAAEEEKAEQAEGDVSDVEVSDDPDEQGGVDSDDETLKSEISLLEEEFFDVDDDEVRHQELAKPLDIPDSSSQMQAVSQNAADKEAEAEEDLLSDSVLELREPEESDLTK